MKGHRAFSNLRQHIAFFPTTAAASIALVISALGGPHWLVGTIFGVAALMSYATNVYFQFEQRICKKIADDAETRILDLYTGEFREQELARLRKIAETSLSFNQQWRHVDKSSAFLFLFIIAIAGIILGFVTYTEPVQLMTPVEAQQAWNAPGAN